MKRVTSRISNLIVGVTAIIAIPTALASGAEPGEMNEAEIASSVLRSHATNLEAIRSFDVLITTGFQLEAPGLIAPVKEEQLRISADYDRRCAFFIRRVVEKDPKTFQTLKTVRYAAIYCDKTFSVRRIPAAVQSTTSQTFNSALRTLGCPEIRFIGISEYPWPMVNDDMRQFLMTRFKTPVKSMSLQTGARGDQTVVVDFPKERETDLSFQRSKWTFEASDNLMRSFRTEVAWQNESNSISTTPSFLESYEWTEFKGIFVPTVILGEKRASIPAELQSQSDAELSHGSEIYDIQLEWLSLNDPIEEKLLKPSLLNDEIALEKLLKSTEN